MEILHITKDNFQSLVLEADHKVVLDFWAPWCGPCRMVAPVLEELAAEYDTFQIAKINVDDEPQLAQQFGIASIPTLIVMEGGKAVGQMIGFRPKADILKLIEG